MSLHCHPVRTIEFAVIKRPKNKTASPFEGDPQDGDVPVDLGAVPERLDVGGVDGDGVDQSAHTQAVTGCRERQWSRQSALIQAHLRHLRHLRHLLPTFGTWSLTLLAAVDAVLLHLVEAATAGTDAGAARHHVVI